MDAHVLSEVVCEMRCAAWCRIAMLAGWLTGWLADMHQGKFTVKASAAPMYV